MRSPGVKRRRVGRGLHAKEGGSFAHREMELIRGTRCGGEDGMMRDVNGIEEIEGRRIE